MNLPPNQNPNFKRQQRNPSYNSINEIRMQLLDQGFQPSVIDNAIQATNCGSFEQCLEYILSNQNSPSNTNSQYYTRQQHYPNPQNSQDFRKQAYERRREAFMQIKMQRQQEAIQRQQRYQESAGSRPMNNYQSKSSPQPSSTENTIINQTCTDNNCSIPTANKKTGDEYSVISPIGQFSIQFIDPCPRLPTIEGKRIAIVGGSFMASVTHPELKLLFLKEFPTAKIFILNEIGSAGVFPGPSVKRPTVELFQRKLKEMKIDAVISGNCGCGLCTPKEAGSSIAAEYVGIPTVTIAAPGFSEQVLETAHNNGLRMLRVATYPGAFSMHTREELLSNTDNVLWPQIKDNLTRTINDSEKVSTDQIIEGDPRQTVFHGTIDEINRYFNEMNWSDGLPVIPPTNDRIDEFLKFAKIGYDTHIAVLPIANRKTLAIHVACCGVMSGCRPEYMPILIALTKALGHPEFRRTLSSTHAWNPYCFINGPIARQLSIDSGQGEISSEANISIGRFMNLALKNLSGYYIKQDRMGTFGYLMPWCLVEDEEACLRAGWSPYHVDHGYQVNNSTITLTSALLWGNNMAPSSTDPQKVIDLIAWDITERCQFALGSGKQFTFRTILMTEPIASCLRKSCPSKKSFENVLIDRARRPLHERAFANYYANPGSNQELKGVTFQQYEKIIASNEGSQLTKIPDWYAKSGSSKEDKIETVPVMQKGMTAIIVTGDPMRNKVQIMPGGGFSTVKIEIPDNWNQLVCEIGYQPIENYYLH